MDDPLHAEIELLRAEEFWQADMVLALAKVRTATEACRQIGVSRGLWTHLGRERKAQIRKLADQVRHKAAVRAYYKLVDAADDAADEKLLGLKSQDEGMRQRTASEILDRAGVEKQKVQKGEVEHRVQVHVGWEQALMVAYGDRLPKPDADT